MDAQDNRASGLTREQKAEVRSAFAAYRSEHPDAKLAEIREHLDLPYKERLTIPVLRGLAPRSPRGGAQKEAAPADGRRAGRRGAPRKQGWEEVLGRLRELRSQQRQIAEEIAKLEEDLRLRLRQELGEEDVRRIFVGANERAPVEVTEPVTP